MKVLRIDVNRPGGEWYQVPEDNPFLPEPGLTPPPSMPMGSETCDAVQWTEGTRSRGRAVAGCSVGTWARTGLKRWTSSSKAVTRARGGVPVLPWQTLRNASLGEWGGADFLPGVWALEVDVRGKP